MMCGTKMTLLKPLDFVLMFYLISAALNNLVYSFHWIMVALLAKFCMFECWNKFWFSDAYSLCYYFEPDVFIRGGFTPNSGFCWKMFEKCLPRIWGVTVLSRRPSGLREDQQRIIVVTHSKEVADSADIILELSGKKLKKVNKMNLEVE
mgnify:CR=1 FL=1